MQELAPLLKKLDQSYKRKLITEKTYHILKNFIVSYAKTALARGTGYEYILKMFDTYINLLEERHIHPFVFEPYHQQILTPFNYYNFGLDFFRPIINTDHSEYLGKENLQKINQQIKDSNNVILFANHQTEGDPQIISLLLEKDFPELAQKMISVAGHRVTTDSLAVPFSMGRNLLCVFSKKHIHNPPHLEAEKRIHNKKTMQVMSELLKEGGKCIYVAPSGGRDRPNADGEFEVSHFDAKSIELFYLMTQKANVKTHYYPLALLTHKVLPPPNEVEKELGEEREIEHSGVYAAFGKEVDMIDFPGHHHENKIKQRHARADFIWSQVNHDYKELKKIQGSYE